MPDGLRAISRPMRKLSESSECSAALGIPKVALLFLTQGDMPLEEVCPTPVPPSSSQALSNSSRILSVPPPALLHDLACMRMC